ncbi:E3 ubiquitin-protein ligase rnf19b, partial [Dermatophagoides pteronyssinus]
SSNDVNENKSYIRHNPSLHSNSSESSNEHRAMDSRRKRNTMTPKKIDNWPFHSNNNNNNTSHSMKQQNSYECPICLLEQPLFQFPELITCQHRACFNCLRQYLRIEIYESRINITCLQCQELMHPNDIKTLLHNDHNAIEKYESFMVRRTLITDPDVRWCPAPDCDYCVIATGCASCPMLKCERPGCETLFCYHCKQEWHPSQTCDQARAQRGFISSKSVFISSPNPNKSNVTFTSRANDLFSQAHASTSMDSFVPREDIKPCPCCKVFIIKMNDGSCNHMTCSVCGTEFCWLCMQKISDLHYLSPSGCTFWGKKPWSRKKKIMWQLGMLVGAPVGIALIAGIAVPAIIIGIPVWVGRKLYSRFERNHMSRHKSNLFVTTGVLASIFVSPILAAVAVGIGVPLLLAYVYGVVPISLCRSGGCGVSTSSSGVRIELDEDEIPAPDGVSVDTALSGRAVTNPSIGDVSLGMSASLSIGSNSHLDRVVLDIQPDRESSSIAACAGSITSNYINNNNGNNNQHGNIHGAQMKLETLTDINSNNKRFSLSSQNADSSSVTLSFGDRSVNTNPSLIDDASLKAHAGSLLEASTNVLSVSTNNNGTQLSLSPVEVHVINDSLENDKKQSNLTTKTSSVAVPAETAIQNVQVPVNLILNKFESRSMEYLSNNYCNICHKSHKPCCPNFQHPNKTIKLTDVNTNKKLPQQKPITFVVGQPRID